MRNNQIVADGEVVDQNFMEHSDQDVESRRMPFIPVTQNALTLYFHLVPFSPDQAPIVATPAEGGNATTSPPSSAAIAQAVSLNYYELIKSGISQFQLVYLRFTTMKTWHIQI